ncbi:peptide ABC transporter substrate-binding protein [Sphaerisporangium melleum]|uniref:Peptide ABC transporter substrate-binding protein n=1 Tax=Sphaerisporangium melleum TaxID=321316 RepID=A0A917VD78_9ACTN|nr:peptide ABC transporter substrate-binding protein [Sphaerisporangium melleum]GII68041.1 peptide ABC transporter substrate-binding protein [Sphaerisporangium melleum]
MTAAAGEIAVAICPPGRLLEPAEQGAECGSEAVSAMFTGLVEYIPGTAATRLAVASSITTKDNKVFTVRLKKGWRFHDGSEVKARNFVRAWNHAVSGDQDGSGYFTRIAGYDKVTASRGLAGLKVLGDHAFTITLARPYGGFVSLLTNSAFAPLPDMFFKDRAAYRRKPVGDGPFRFVSRSGDQITVERFDGYGGAAKPQVAKIVYRSFDVWDDAYKALVRGEIDFLPDLPRTTGLNGRVLERPYPGVHMLSMPMAHRKVAGNADFRRAISMAIPRDEVVKPFQGARVPADSFIPPPTPGRAAGACGKACRYDPAAARAALAKAQAAGFTPPKEFALYYNEDGGHGDWVKLVAKAVTKTFRGKLKVVPKGKATFGALLELMADGSPKGMSRWAWVEDGLHLADVLSTYRTGSEYNYGEYSNRRFDALLDAADRTTSKTKAASLYRRAEKVLAADMPAIPLFFYRSKVGYSENVSNVQLTPYGLLDIRTVKA